MPRLQIIKFTIFLLFLLQINSKSFAQQTLQTQRPIVFTKPVELNWHSLTWPTIDYKRVPVDGGAALYSFPSDQTLKFKIHFVFPGGVYAIAREQRPALGALADLLMLGGFGNLNFDEIQNYLNEYGIELSSSLSAEGQLVITAEALTQDFSRVLDILSNLILRPRFDEAALPLWKQETADSFQNLLNSNTFEKQYRFIEKEAITIAFGPDHYFAKAIDRASPATLNKVTYEQIKKLYTEVVQRNGLNVFLSGNFSPKDLGTLKNIIVKIPTLETTTPIWLPSRTLQKSEPGQENKIRTEIIHKPGMTQANISLRFYFPQLGNLNSIEDTQFDILQEIFSSSGGIIGNDRFSKALRANTGISYSPHAYFNDKVLYPNTNVGLFNLNFQSPNERIAEAISLAIKTWNDFVTEGPTQEELDNTRTAMMNRMLAKEITVFDKVDMFMAQMAREEIPTISPVESDLVKLDKQRNLENIKETLKHYTQEQIVPVLVIMGNPTQEQIEQLKKIEGIDRVNVKNIDDIVKSLSL